MSNTNNVEPLRIRQLRAIAENLRSLANLHRENHNYVIADALYVRSLSVAEQIHSSENDVVGSRIRTEQQVAHNIHSGNNGGR